MGALPQAVPLALAAAIYPPAIIVCALLLTGDRPRLLVSSYFAGAATVVVGVGIAGLALLDGVGATESQSHRTSAGLDVVLGVVLLALAAWMWPRRDRADRAQGAPREPGRIARISDHARSSARWAFVLGVAMYLPSPWYLAAVKTIADEGGPTGGNILAVLVCAACVLLFVEVPLVLLLLSPDTLEDRLNRVQAAISRHAWTVGVLLAVIAGAFLLVRGIARLA